MDLGLNDKTAIVAASSKGLGKAVAHGLAAEGANVTICARHSDVLDKTAAEIREKTGAQVLAVQADLSEASDIKNVVRQTIDRFGTVHVLVTNSGGPPPGFFDDFGDEQWYKAVDSTLMSAVRLTREVLPVMRKQRWGRIIHITSVSVKQPIDSLLLSNAIRPAVVGMAKTLAGQLARDNVLVNNVCPGWTRTDRVDQLLKARAAREGVSPEEVYRSIASDIPIGRMAEPQEFANMVVFLASERASYITGGTFPVDGGAIKGIFG
jgi:3-oxoacyl-[acyl-carrier protein] reductase